MAAHNDRDSSVPSSYVPTDTVSSLTWQPAGDHFVATSWGKEISCYQLRMDDRTPKAQRRQKYDHNEPVLCSTWSEDGATAFFASTDGRAYRWNMRDNKVQPIAQHGGPITAIKSCPGKGLVATSSLDRTVKFWDLRRSRDREVASLDLRSKVFSFDVLERVMVIGVTIKPDEQKVGVVDMANFNKIRSAEPCPLKHYIASISLFQDTSGYVVGGIEGRIAVTHFPSAKKKDFVFKCHRMGQSDTHVYPIHNIVTHPSAKSIFSSCGGDGTIAFWDRDSQTRVKSFYKSGSAPITAMALHNQGRALVYARGYDWAKGYKHFAAERRKYDVGIFIRLLQESDIKPSSRY